MKYAPYFKPEIIEGLVRRCEGSGKFHDTPELADAAGKEDGRPYVVADEVGAVYVEAPAEPKPATTRRARR